MAIRSLYMVTELTLAAMESELIPIMWMDACQLLTMMLSKV